MFGWSEFYVCRQVLFYNKWDFPDIRHHNLNLPSIRKQVPKLYESYNFSMVFMQ